MGVVAAATSVEAAAVPLGNSDVLRPPRRWRPPVPKGVGTGAPLCPRLRALGRRPVGVSEHRCSKMLTFSRTLPRGGVSSRGDRGAGDGPAENALRMCGLRLLGEGLPFRNGLSESAAEALKPMGNSLGTVPSATTCPSPSSGTTGFAEITSLVDRGGTALPNTGVVRSAAGGRSSPNRVRRRSPPPCVLATPLLRGPSAPETVPPPPAPPSLLRLPVPSALGASAAAVDGMVPLVMGTTVPCTRDAVAELWREMGTEAKALTVLAMLERLASCG